jgi:DnaJ-domain-containing protein 1
MPTILIGLVVLILVLWALHTLARSNPRALAAGVKTAGGYGALAGAVALAATGRVAIALPLGIAGLALLGWWPGLPAGYGQRWNKSPGQISRVRTAFMEMELEHDTGRMDGRILAGRHEGATLGTLDVATLTGMLGDIDDESRALLAAYLDSRDSGWREHADGDTASRSSGTSGGGPMTQEEAYQILGVQPEASTDEISRAHRTLMKKLHPDQGGSTYLAARVNQAKDILLRRHR